MAERFNLLFYVPDQKKSQKKYQIMADKKEVKFTVGEAPISLLCQVGLNLQRYLLFKITLIINIR